MRIRTGYSFRKAFGPLTDVMDRIEWPFAPITDTASTFGFNRWTKLCKERKKKPIYGVEIAVTPSRNERQITYDHFTFIARERLEPLHALLAKATSQFRYEPLLTYEDLDAVDPSIIICVGKAPVIEAMRPTEAWALLLSPSTARPVLDWALANGMAILPSSDNRYPAPDDALAYNVVVGKMAQRQSYPQHILAREEWLRIWDMPEAFDNLEWVASLCNAELLPAELYVPERTKTLKQLCIEGAERLQCNLRDPVYSARLERELEMIQSKKFEDYFFIIADMINEAKKHMLVGPARGSSCGSLVCYLTGITTVDPIPHDLLFERFIDINRKDLPDIDIDFSDQNRQIIFDYMSQKYGKEHVARLGTVALYKPKSAINEVGAACKIPRYRIDEFTGAIIERSSGDSRFLNTLEDAFSHIEVGKKLIEDFPELSIATRLEGHPRHYSQHAAGIVITKKPIVEHIAVDARTNATQCDKADAETLGFLKIDALGLTQLSVFEDCLAMIGRAGDWQWLYSLPLDDPAAFEVLNDGKFTGIFQWNGQAVQSITQQTHIEAFDDIAAIGALARPGPLVSGGAEQWVRRKNREEAITYPHKMFESILSTSLGIVIYQEQVMQIVRHVGGFSWEETGIIRSTMAKSKGEEFFNQQGKRFKEGALKTGLPEAICDTVWKQLCAYGSWSFNKSHAVAYGHISYWCCYLKAHFATEFAAATLSHEDDPDKQLKMLRELAAEGIAYIPLDPERSTDKWNVYKGKLIGPLRNVRGIGPKMMDQIMHCRRLRLPLPKRAVKLLSKPITSIDDLYPIQARLAQIAPDLSTRGIISKVSKIADLSMHEEATHVIIGKVTSIAPRDINDPQKVAKRGYKMKGKQWYLNLVVEDDSDRIMVSINRFKFERTGKPIMERGDAGNVIYAFKGKTAKGFRMLHVESVKFIDYLTDKKEVTDEEEEAGVTK